MGAPGLLLKFDIVLQFLQLQVIILLHPPSLPPFNETKLKCLAESSCARAAREALATRERDGSLNGMQNYTAAFRPLSGWLWGTDSGSMKKLCAPCQTQSKRKDEEGCREAWLKLPAMLNIEVPGWPARTEFPARGPLGGCCDR
ncbi:hypothetical protein V8D89_004260 [Ganoderma adspersum]